MAAAPDREAVEGAGWRAPPNVDVRDRGAGWPTGKCVGETLEHTSRTLSRGLHRPIRLVRDPPGEAKAQSFASDEIAEPDPLDETFDPQVYAGCLGVAQGVGLLCAGVAGPVH